MKYFYSLPNWDAPVLQRIIEAEWHRVSRELDNLDIDSDDAIAAANLAGQFHILDKLMAALSGGSLSSDYEIEAEWRSELIERVVAGFNLKFNTKTPPRRYKSLAQRVAEACELEVIQE
ncbi:MAG: hypothetical protein EBE86_027455 [Hormoscilla sp. GUM202]|nr:hypothetical protein [Hormoscilla sp. GUM202]